MGVINISEATFAEMHRRLSHYEEAGMFILDARRFLKSGSPILSEISALQTKLETANRQYDLDSLPLLEQDVEEAKAKARTARTKLIDHQAKDVSIRNAHDSLHRNYANAVDKINTLKLFKLDPYASKAEVDRHKASIAKAQQEADRYLPLMDEEFVTRSSWERDLARYTNEFKAAANEVTKSEMMLRVVRKRLGIADDTVASQDNKFGLSSGIIGQ